MYVCCLSFCLCIDLAGDADPELGTLLGDQPSSSLPHAHLHSSGMGGSSMGSEGTAGSGNGGGWLSSLFSLEAYQVYFDVNTQLIGSRLSKALMPFGEELFYQVK